MRDVSVRILLVHHTSRSALKFSSVGRTNVRTYAHYATAGFFNISSISSHSLFNDHPVTRHYITVDTVSVIKQTTNWQIHIYTLFSLYSFFPFSFLISLFYFSSTFSLHISKWPYTIRNPSYLSAETEADCQSSPILYTRIAHNIQRMYTHDNAKHSQTRTWLQASQYCQIRCKAYTHVRQQNIYVG